MGTTCHASRQERVEHSGGGGKIAWRKGKVILYCSSVPRASHNFQNTWNEPRMSPVRVTDYTSWIPELALHIRLGLSGLGHSLRSSNPKYARNPSYMCQETVW